MKQSPDLWYIQLVGGLHYIHTWKVKRRLQKSRARQNTSAMLVRVVDEAFVQCSHAVNLNAKDHF